MKLIDKSQDQNDLLQYLSRGNKFTFPTNKLVENQKRISGTKRDMRRKFIKSARPTYNQNRIVNRAQEGMKFAEFKPVDIPGLQENYTAAEMVDILLANRNNSEFDYLQEFEDMDDILGISQQQNDYNIIDNLSIEYTPIVSDNKNGFNVDAAVSYLTSHAHNSSVKQCAKFVRKALEAGGINTADHPESAADYIGYMHKFGFDLVSKGYGDKLPEDYTPQKGDVVVIGRVGSHRHGHIAMYNGEQWVSDFKQKSFKIYDTIKDYTIWRHN